jgi:hypothetical protein
MLDSLGATVILAARRRALLEQTAVEIRSWENVKAEKVRSATANILDLILDR